MPLEDVLEFEAGETAVFEELAGFGDERGGVEEGDGVEGDGHVEFGVVRVYISGYLWWVCVYKEDRGGFVQPGGRLRRW